MKKLQTEIDMIHIDASHEYESVMEDILLWWQLLRSGGVMLGDDYQRAWPGVIKAVNEFTSKRNLTLTLSKTGTKWIVWKP